MRFVVSGTEAVLTAVRLARAHTGRRLLLKFSGCYHGHVDSLLVAAGSGVATLGIPGSAGVTDGTVADTLIAPYNDEDALVMWARDIDAPEYLALLDTYTERYGPTTTFDLVPVFGGAAS